MNIDAKKFFFSFFFFIATLAGLGYYYFSHEQNLINQKFNADLERVAQAAQAIIGHQYHDQIMSLPPSEIEDANIIKTLTTLANAEGVMHIHSLILDPQGNLRFASSSTHDKVTHFYDKYPRNKEVFKAFLSKNAVYGKQLTSDQKEAVRSIFVPHMTPSGHRYVIGVEMEVHSINKLSNAAAFSSFASSLIVFLGIFPFFLLYRNMLQHNNEILKERVELATNELREINEQLDEKVKEKTYALTETLYYDRLTTLPNRLKLQEDLTLYYNHTVALFNIDDFKEINDFFGIDTGDDILKDVANWLQEMELNPYRIGGDEFAIIFPNELSQEEIQAKMVGLLTAFVEENFMIGDEILHMHATMGVAIMSNKPLIHADVALHKARDMKQSCSVYDSSEGIEKQYKNNIAMSAQIRQALIEHRVICQYQPIVDCKSGDIHKYETLVRIQLDDGTLIPPNDILPIAKKTKLYSTITQEVIYQACHTFMNRTETFSVNLSITDILDPHTLTTIERILKQTKTQNRIIFEILESEGIENYNEVEAFITRVKEFGAKIAIDDFGSGYSNFENILKLNVDFLKIDGSLIKNIDQDSRHRIIVESIVNFTHRIGIKTIAEFVASEKILAIVTELGVTYAQGYYTGKPQFLD
jgi:diguanylate cyclase (GGDEF)-like protein